MSDGLDEQTAARLGVLAEPKKHVPRVKGRPVEDFLFATLRCVDAERYGALTIMDTDPRWAFVQACADVLASVLDQQDAHAARTAADAEPGPGLLTVVEMNHVATLIEIVIAWGVAPALSSGLGVPLASRLTSTSLHPRPLATALASKAASALMSAERAELDMDTTRTGGARELEVCAKVLVRLCKDAVFGGTMASKYSVDVVAALLQLAYGPRQDVAGPETASDVVQHAEESLQWVVDNFPVDVVFGALMGLMRPSVPQWARRRVGALLDRWLLCDGAVFILVNGMMRSGTEEAREHTITNAVRRVASVPRGIPCDAYYRAVCPQVARIVQQVTSKADDATVRCGLVIMRALADQQPDLAHQYMVQPTLDLLRSGVASERLLEVHVVYLHRLLCSTETEQAFGAAAEPLFPTLFDLLVRVRASVAPLKRVARECVVATLAHASDPVRCVLALLARDPDAVPYRFVTGPTGGIAMVRAQHQQQQQQQQQQASEGLDDGGALDEDEEFRADEAAQAQVLVELLKAAGHDDVVGTLFLELLRRVGGKGKDEEAAAASDGSKKLCAAVVAELAQAYRPEQLLDSVVQLAEFVRTLLCAGDQASASIGVLVLRGLLGSSSDAPAGGALIRPEHAFLFHEMVPALESLCATSADTSLVATARELLDTLTSAEPTWTERPAPREEQATAAAEEESSNESKQLRPVLFVLEQQLAAPTLAERGAALVKLRKLVLERNKAVAGAVPDVLALFVRTIQKPQEEDFVCDTAISGLACLGDLYPALVVPQLLRLFADGALADAVRARVGEALLQTLRVQGDMVVRFLAPAMSVLLSSATARNPAVVRASALSIVDALVRSSPIAHFAGVLPELLDALRCVLQTDDSALVRRGATLVCVALALSMLSTTDAAAQHTDDLVRMRAWLQAAARQDSDDIVRHNAAVAADAITEHVPLLPE